MTVERSGGVLVTREETLAGREFFAVSLYSSPNAAAAQAESARYAPRGASGRVLHADGLAHAVGALLPDEEQARAECDALLGAEGIAAQMVKITVPEVLLRITATQSQLSTLLQADETLSRAVEELGSIAQQIDGGAIDLQGAQGLVYAQAARMAAVGEELTQRTRGEKEPVSGALSALLAQAAQSAEQTAGQRSPARLAFSSAVRALQIEILSDWAAWRADLAAGGTRRAPMA